MMKKLFVIAFLVTGLYLLGYSQKNLPREKIKTFISENLPYATTLAHFKDAWKGTLIMIAQQAEEKSGGANSMISAGLFQKFPVPNVALALHVSPEIEAGKVGYTPGPAFAGVNSVDIHVYGVGGHGAYPHKTIQTGVWLMSTSAIKLLDGE